MSLYESHWNCAVSARGGSGSLIEELVAMAPYLILMLMHCTEKR